MMGWFGPSGSCGCCTDVCTECTNITWVSISGLANADCTGGCDGKNGTYIFRTTGAAIPSNCTWTVKTWANHNCGLDDDPLLYVGGIYTGCADVKMTLQLTNVSGGITARVTIAFSYMEGNSPNTAMGTYVARWEKTFASCSAISGALDFLSSSSSICPDGDGNMPGDLCGLLSATVSVG